MSTNKFRYIILAVIGGIVFQLFAVHASAITRSQVIANAKQYASYRWQVKSGNASRKYNFFKTGQWVTGVAYNWGGTDTIGAFSNKINQRKIAGNVYSKYGIHGTFAGLDCSAFVNRVWGWPGRYTTKYLYKIASTISWSKLQAGDAVNKPGSHVRLFHYFTSGTHRLMVYESTPGHVIHRVVSRDGYTPMRYNRVEGGSPSPSVPTPVVTSVSPNPLRPLPISQRQWITIYGKNFTTTSRLEFQIVGGARFQNRVPIYKSATELRYKISVGQHIRDWTVKVLNSGKVSNRYRFKVRRSNQVKPVIASVSPNPIRPLSAGQRQPFMLKGSGFVSGARLLFKIVDTPSYTYPDRVPASLSSNRIVYNINVGPYNHHWTVQVINPDGQASNIYPFKAVAPIPIKYYTVAVAKTGTGSGTVTSRGINCGSDCSEKYAVGSVLDLKANPAAGSVFAGWLVNGNPVTGAIPVRSNLNLTAKFENGSPAPTPKMKPLYRLYLGIGGNGWSDHLDSRNANEIGTCQRRLGYVYTTQAPGTKPLYQIYRSHDTSGRDIKDDHMTSDNLSEVTSGSINGGVLGYVYTTQVSGTVPLYRKYRRYWYTIWGGKRLLHTDHITTTDRNEGSSSGWVYERVLGYIKGPAASSCR